MQWTVCVFNGVLQCFCIISKAEPWIDILALRTAQSSFGIDAILHQREYVFIFSLFTPKAQVTNMTGQKISIKNVTIFPSFFIIHHKSSLNFCQYFKSQIFGFDIRLMIMLFAVCGFQSEKILFSLNKVSVSWSIQALTNRS